MQENKHSNDDDDDGDDDEIESPESNPAQNKDSSQGEDGAVKSLLTGSSWITKEDDVLMKCILKYEIGENLFHNISQAIGSKSAQQCLFRWNEILTEKKSALKYVSII